MISCEDTSHGQHILRIETGLTPSSFDKLAIINPALALVVLCGAGLMIASLSKLLGVDPGLIRRMC